MEVDISQEIFQDAFLAIQNAMETATVKGTDEKLFNKVFITDAYPLPETDGETPEPLKRLHLTMNDPDYVIGVIAFTLTWTSTNQISLDDEDGIEVALTYQIDLFATGGFKKLKNRVFSFLTNVFLATKDNVTVSWDGRTGLDGGPETYLDEYKCRGYIFKLDCVVTKIL